MPKIYDIKNLILVGAMLCALGMMTACKSGTANNKEKTLVGHWETVAATERWDCSESPEEMVAAGSAADTTQYNPKLDSAEYRYISFDIDEDSITMVEHDKGGCDPVPPLEISKSTHASRTPSRGTTQGIIPSNGRLWNSPRTNWYSRTSTTLRTAPSLKLTR